jgi:hypothetical protein
VDLTLGPTTTDVNALATVTDTGDKQLEYVQGRDADGDTGPLAAVWIGK